MATVKAKAHVTAQRADGTVEVRFYVEGNDAAVNTVECKPEDFEHDKEYDVEVDEAPLATTEV